jgi:RNA polymerase sigma factor (sigma-70 family)
VSAASTRRIARADRLPGYLYHDSFADASARRQYDPRGADQAESYSGGYMPEEVTRDHAKRMHYAAHRLRLARTRDDRAKWQASYVALRDAIVLGNRKLVFRAVRRRMALSYYAEDMIGDCQIVLIQAVAAFDPWLGVRFSTYAYTCLIRAIARTSQRLSADFLTRTVSFEALPDGEPGDRFQPPSSPGQIAIEEFLRDDHPLLSPREKAILSRRYFVSDRPGDQTLEKVGLLVGLSKERVRQVQQSALLKLRRALALPTPD